MKQIVNILAMVKLGYNNRYRSIIIKDGKYVKPLLILLESHGFISYFTRVAPYKFIIFLFINKDNLYHIEICYKHHQNFLQPYKNTNKSYFKGQRWLILEYNTLKIIPPRSYKLGEIIARFS